MTTPAGNPVQEFADGSQSPRMRRKIPAPPGPWPPRCAPVPEATRGAVGENTERALKSDLRVFAAWCAGRRLPALPAHAATIAAFVDAMARARAPATVRRYVASIAAVHKALGHAKAARAAPVQLALKRMHRTRGRRQAQARGLTWPLRQRLLAAVGNRPIDDRNRALVAVAYDGMLRRSELTALEVDDLMEEVDGSGALLVRRGKTDPEGRGAVVYLAPDTVALLRAWRARAGIEAGRLFRSVGRDGTLGTRLDASQVPAHLQGDGAPRGAAGRSGAGALRAQRAGRRGAGHDRLGHRPAGDPAGGALEDHRDGQPLRRAGARAAQRRGAARPSAAAQLSACGGCRTGGIRVRLSRAN